MFDSFAQIFPAQWQGGVLLLLAPLRWLAEVQSTIVQAILGAHPAGRLLLWVVLLIPALVIAVGMWCTALSLYTIPFRSGRGTFLTAVLMTWWDAGRCIWLFWSGMLRVGVALVGWVIGSVKFGLLMLKNMLFGLVRSPLTLLDGASRSYFQYRGSRSLSLRYGARSSRRSSPSRCSRRWSKSLAASPDSIRIRG